MIMHCPDQGIRARNLLRMQERLHDQNAQYNANCCLHGLSPE